MEIKQTKTNNRCYLVSFAFLLNFRFFYLISEKTVLSQMMINKLFLDKLWSYKLN